MWKKADEDTMDTNTNSNTSGNSTIAPKSITVGEIKGNEDLLILGMMDGVINLGKNTVTIGKTGIIKGNINSQAIMVEGKVEGDLQASSRIILRKSARVKGNIKTGNLVMEDGCFFQGNIDMATESAKSVTPPAAVKNSTTTK